MTATRRLVLILTTLVAAFAAVPGIASAGFSISKLRLGGPLGPQNYLFTSGDTVYASGNVESGTYYRYVVSDPSAIVRSTSTCTASPGSGRASATFLVQSSSPVSNATAWRYQLQQFAAAGCAGSPTKTDSLYFDVARATAYTSSTLATPKAAFTAGQVAYVNALGIGKAKGSAANASVNDWSTSWLLPFGTACANTSGGDRPDSTAGGLFPSGIGALGTGGYLQYRPNLLSTGDSWNREAGYETRPCPDFGSGNQGLWRVYLKRDNTHFVTLPVFSVDTTAPDTTVTGGPAGPTNATQATMQFTSDATAATFTCRLDGGTWQACSSPNAYAGLVPGAHNFDVRATDEAGNVDPTPASRSWSVDTTLPAVTLATPADGGWTDATPSFSGAAGAAAGDSATVVVKLFSGSSVAGSPLVSLDAARAGNSWSVSTSPLGDGTYTAYAQQSDAAANIGFSEQHTFTVDSTPPLVTLAFPVAGASTNDVSPGFAGTGGLLSGDAADVAVDIYSGTSATGTPLQTQAATVEATGTWTTSADPELAEGIYIARARQSDMRGSTGYSPAHVFTVDTTAPMTSITSGPVGTTAANSATFRFVSSESGSTFQCRLDSGTWGTCASPKSYFDLDAGAHTFAVRAIDRAGNLDEEPDTRGWTVNGGVPDVFLTIPSDGSSTSDTTPMLAGTAGTAAGDSATVTVTIYSLSSGSAVLLQTRSASAAADGSWSVNAFPALVEGPYLARAEQAGTAGTGSSGENAFTVDTTAPDTSITLGPSGTTTSTSASFQFSSSEAGSTFECRLDTGAWAACTSPRDYSGLPAGAHTFAVRAVDMAGNADPAPASASWTVDPSVPAVSITFPADGSYNAGGAPLIGGVGGIAAGDADTVTVAIYSGDILIATQTAFRSSSDGTWSLLVTPRLDEGIYVARASQVGTSGTGHSAPLTFIVDATAPSTSITEGPTGSTTATTARFRFLSSEPGSTFQCRLDGGAWTACTSPAAYSGLSESSHTFEVRSIDAAGNVDPFAGSRTWLVDPTAPPVTLTTPGDDTITTDSTPALAGTAGTAANDEPTVTVEIYDGGSVSDEPVAVLTTTRSSVDGSWSVVVSPALADGVYVAFAWQADATGNTGFSAARTFTVDTTPAAVTLTNPTNGSSSTESMPLLAGAAGTDAGDSTTVTVTVYGGSQAQGAPVRTLIATAVAGTWSIAATPAVAVGTYTARAEQGDLAGNTGHSAAVTFSVAAPSSGGSGDTGGTGDTGGSGGTGGSAGTGGSEGSGGSTTTPTQPAPPATPPAQPAPPATSTPTPALALTLQRPKLRTLLKKRKLMVYATCDQACSLKVTVKFSVKRSGKTRMVKMTKTVNLLAAQRTTLQLKLTKQARVMVLRALKHHRKVTVNLLGSASAPSGAVASAKLRFSGKR